MKNPAGPKAYTMPLFHFKHQREEDLLSLRFDPAEDLEQRSRRGDIRAGFLLAHLLSTGQGVVADPAHAQRTYQRLRRQLFFRPYRHDAETAFDKARLHHFGWGGRANPKKALRYFRACRRLFRQDADQGDRYATHRLAALYFHGLGGDKDGLAAMHYLRLAAESGLVHAELDMTELLWHGLGGWMDKTEAARFLEKAANNNRMPRFRALMAEAQYRMGLMALEGLGTTVSLKSGYVWLAIAARYGHEAANERRKALDQRLSLSQQLEFQRAAADWIPRYSPDEGEPPPGPYAAPPTGLYAEAPI